MTTSTKISPPALYVCLISSIAPSVDRDGLFAEIAKILNWDGEQLASTISHATNHVHTKLFMAPKDLAETRATVLAARLQNWLATNSHHPVNDAFRIGVHRNE